MTTRELLETLNNTKSAKAYEAASNPPPPPPKPPLPAIDWVKRKIEKDKLMVKYIKIVAAVFLGILLFFVLPILLAYPSVGRAMLCALPPMVFIGLTWVAGAWYAWDKDFAVFMSCTLGAMPIRLGFGMVWSIFVLRLPDFDATAYFVGLMIFWIAFTIPEFKMLIEFGNKFPRDARQIEP